MKKIIVFAFFFCCSNLVIAQVDPLIEKVSKKLALVNDYVAESVF